VNYTLNYRNCINTDQTVRRQKLWLHRVANSCLQLIPAARLTPDVCRSKFVRMYKYHYVKVLVMNGTRMTNIASVTVTAKFKIELPKYGNTAKIPPSR